jgi:ABC-type multidrug transport system ATPase subunit
MTVIEARGLRKAYGATVALDGIDLRVEEGRILGLIGPNGAGKTTALNAILGLTPYEGELKVLGRNPWTERDRLMVLDEPTLGLDILYRKQFYDSLLNDYFDHTRTIVVTTHQVEEIQHVLTDLMFIDHGRIVLECTMEAFDARYLEVLVPPERVAAAQALGPIHERQLFGRSILLFEHADRPQLAALGEVRTPSIADVFVAVMGHRGGPPQGEGK